MLSNARNQTNNHNYTANWCYIRNISQTKSCVTIICETCLTDSELILHEARQAQVGILTVIL